MQKNNTFLKEQYKRITQGVKDMTTSKAHTKRILTTQEVIDALRRNETVSVTDNILRIQKVFKNNPFMFCNFSNAKRLYVGPNYYYRCNGAGVLSVKENIEDNFVVIWTDEYGVDMLEVYKPINRTALENIYNIITMEEAPEVENLFNIDHCRFCFARPLNR